MLGELLGDTLRLREGQALFDTVERVRALSKHARAGTAHDVGALAGVLRDLPVESALPVARAFSHFLTLANIAEQHHRVRRRRDYQRNPAAGPQPASCEETFPRLIAGGVTPDALYEAACALRIELVLTAHPTEITRRTLIHKHLHIADALMRLDRPDLTVPERAETIEELRARDRRGVGDRRDPAATPDPLDEVTSGLLIFEQTIWDALPRYLRSLDAALRRTTGRALPLDAAPIRFGSWIGGDRDGNPHVTPEVTRVACLLGALARGRSVPPRDVDALRLDLSMTDAIPELQARAGGAREPYRAVLRDVTERLLATRERAGLRLVAHARRVRGTRVPPPSDRVPEDDLVEGHPYESIDELVEPLALCYRSLVETGQQIIADGRLADLLRRTAAFGLTLVRLDIRQHAERHTAALDAHDPPARGRVVRRVDRGAASAFLDRTRCAKPRQRVCPTCLQRDPRSLRTCSRHVRDDRRAFTPSRSAPTSSRWRRRPPTSWRSRGCSASPARTCASCRCSNRSTPSTRAAGTPCAACSALAGVPQRASTVGRRSWSAIPIPRRTAAGWRPTGRSTRAQEQLVAVGRRCRASSSRCSTAAAAASAAAADRPTWRSSHSRQDRSTDACGSPSRAR